MWFFLFNMHRANKKWMHCLPNLFKIKWKHLWRCTLTKIWYEKWKYCLSVPVFFDDMVISNLYYFLTTVRCVCFHFFWILSFLSLVLIFISKIDSFQRRYLQLMFWSIAIGVLDTVVWHIFLVFILIKNNYQIIMDNLESLLC